MRRYTVHLEMGRPGRPRDEDERYMLVLWENGSPKMIGEYSEPNDADEAARQYEKSLE